MVLLIDGYNVLHAVGRGRDESGGERRRFISLVAVYAQKRSHEAIVIFDGGSAASPRQTVIEGVVVIESGYSYSADDLLRQELKHHLPDNVLMVSSDRAITDDAARHNVVSIDADAFYARLINVVCEAGIHNKRSGVDNRNRVQRFGPDSSLDELMEKACKHVRPKAVDVAESEQNLHKGKRKSKAEKRLERVIKKL